jgi:hypothetical protein
MRDPRALSAAALLLIAINIRSAEPAASVSQPVQWRGHEDLTASDHRPVTHQLPRFEQLILDRALLDAWQNRHHRIAPGIIPTPITRFTPRIQSVDVLRVVRAELPAEAADYRAAHSGQVVPHRGFRAPILDAAGSRPKITLDPSSLDTGGRAAAALIEERLTGTGLLATLAEVLVILHRDRGEANPAAVLQRLRDVGFPVDLLGHFRLPRASDDASADMRLGAILERLNEDGPESLRELLNQARFHFQPVDPGFEVATESGEHAVGLLRMQAGGGWRDGVIPGEGIDMINQLVGAFPSADFLISVPVEVAGPFEWLATNAWRLDRPAQATFCLEPVAVEAWAQDNGKAGVIRGSGDDPPRWATLAPRYACIGEGRPVYLPGDSYLMDGLRRSGHRVLHSSLLFQGGNLLAVRDPRSGQRVLLLGEGEILRNVALGLSREQVMEAFTRELGVDQCVVLPAVSYHLDFDVTVRAAGGDLIAFVNDTAAAVRQILSLGVGALMRDGLLSPDAAEAARAELENHHLAALHRRLQAALEPVPANPYPESLSQEFVSAPLDDAAGNLQTFLLAMDLLEAGLETVPDRDHPERTEYLQALRRMELARQAQVAALKQLGWRVVAIPSTPDLHRGMNYLNGIQHRDGYLMPAFGGFFAAVDRAAAAAFRAALGPRFMIRAVRSAECQRKHGAVHCAAAAYPRLEPEP